MSINSFSQTADKTYILISGQWHGAWCWNKVTPLLESKGFKVKALDLPGHGDDTTPVGNVTLEDCVRKVVAEANAQSGQVILVGHSSGGVIMAQAAETLGKDKVASMVFLDAFLPNDGESVFSLAQKFSPNAPTPLSKAFIISEDQKTVSLDFEKVIEFLYHDCSATDIAYAKSHVKPGPIAVLATPVRLTDSNYGSIKKYYIHCTQARDFEKIGMSKNVKCEKTFQLPSSHSAFLSMPDKLVDILVTID